MAVRYGHKYRIPVSAIYHTHFSAHVDLLYLRKVPFASHISRFFLRPLLDPYKNSDRVFVPSNSIQQFLIRKGLEVNKLISWHRGVDSSHFHPAKRNASFAQKHKLAHTKTILFVSRLVRIKETDTLIRFYKLIENQFNLVVVGDGPDRKRMEAKMPEATFTGHLYGEELAQTYASCDLFIFPSTTETFGNVVLEAMASGLPVVAADEGGPRDIVQNGQTGYLVEPNNERAFFEKVLDILCNPSLAETLSQNALAYAQKQNWDVLCKQFFDYLQSLVSAKALGSSLFLVEK